MMNQVIVFGLTELSMVVARSARRDKAFKIEAFCVDRNYLPSSLVFEGAPVVPFDEIGSCCPPEQFSFLCLMSWKHRNRVRAEKVRQISAMGYGFAKYISARAELFPETKVGDNTVILDGVVAGPNVEIGENVVLWQGCTFAHDDYVGNHVYLAPRVAVAGCVKIGERCFIGINASLRDKITLGAGTSVAMGSTVRCNTEPESNYDGVPARKILHSSPLSDSTNPDGIIPK